MGAVISLHRRRARRTNPEDIIFAAPGTPARQAEVIEFKAPARYRASPAQPSLAVRIFWSGALVAYGLFCALAGGYLVFWTMVGVVK